VHRRAQRPRDVEEQHDPLAVGVVPSLVFVGVVEHQRLPLAPVPGLVADADPASLARFGDDQCQVVAQDAAVRAIVRRQTLAGSEDREEACDDAGDRTQDGCRGRAAQAVRVVPDVVANEPEGLPLVVVGQVDLVRSDVLEVGQRVPDVQYAFGLWPHGGVVLLEQGRPRELARGEERLGPNFAEPAEGAVGGVRDAAAVLHDPLRPGEHAGLRRDSHRAPPVFAPAPICSACSGGKGSALLSCGAVNVLSRVELTTTLMLDSAIAAAAISGDSKTPVKGYSTPAATGIAAVL
jgi:hypothetical protein